MRYNIKLSIKRREWSFIKRQKGLIVFPGYSHVVLLRKVFNTTKFAHWLWQERRRESTTNSNSPRKRALAVYFELGQKVRKDYNIVKDTLINTFQLPDARFIALHEFESRRMLPG